MFLHPVGITNAASFSPFTSSVAPGEFVTLFGSGLSDSTAVATSLPFQTTLGGVQVLVNGQPITLYSVSPTQISGVLPYSLPPRDYATFSVVNNGRTSNTVTQYTSQTAPGVFTNPANGLGIPSALRPDFSVVTRANPARVGETIALYVSGLGAVSPAVPAGAAAPSNPLSRISAEFINVLVDGADANVHMPGSRLGSPGCTRSTSQYLPVWIEETSSCSSTCPGRSRRRRCCPCSSDYRCESANGISFQ